MVVSESTLAALVATMVKLSPGFAGALVALMMMPSTATRGERLTAFLGGLTAALFIGPALVEWAGIISPRLDAGVGFACGVFGMAVVSEITAAIRTLKIGDIARNWLKRRTGDAS